MAKSLNKGSKELLWFHVVGLMDYYNMNRIGDKNLEEKITEIMEDVLYYNP